MAAQSLRSSSTLPTGQPRRAARSRRGRNVERLGARVARACQRNDCPAPARAGVELDHPGQVATLVDLPRERDPRRMELCADHAATMTVPRGWTRRDERIDVDDTPPSGPVTVTELRSEATRAALAAALGGRDASSASAAGTGADRDERAETDAGVGARSVATVKAAALHDSSSVASRATEPAAGDTPDDDGRVAPGDDDRDEDPAAGGRQLAIGDEERRDRARPVPAARRD